MKRVFAKNFSPLRGETRSVSRPPRVVSHGTIRFPLRPPILGEFRGKAKTLTPNISSPEGGRGALPVPNDAPRGSLLKFKTSGVWAPPLIFGRFFPKISNFFRGQKAHADMTHSRGTGSPSFLHVDSNTKGLQDKLKKIGGLIWSWG